MAIVMSMVIIVPIVGPVIGTLLLKNLSLQEVFFIDRSRYIPCSIRHVDQRGLEYQYIGSVLRSWAGLREKQTLMSYKTVM